MFETKLSVLSLFVNMLT